MDTYSLVSQAAASLPPQTAAPQGERWRNQRQHSRGCPVDGRQHVTTLLTDVETRWKSYIGFAPSGDTTTTGWTSVLGDLGITGTVQADLAERAGFEHRELERGVLLPTQGIYYAAMFGQHARQDVDQHEQLDAGQPGDPGEQPGAIGQRLATRREQDPARGSGAWPARCGRSGRRSRRSWPHRAGWAACRYPNGWADSGAGDESCRPNVAGHQCQRTDHVDRPAQQPVHPSADGIHDRPRRGQPGRQAPRPKVVQESPAGG